MTPGRAGVEIGQANVGRDLNVQIISPEPPPKPRLAYEPETVLIAAGSFHMGREPEPGVPDHETPVHSVELTAYEIAVHPVTNRDYAAYIKANPAVDAPKGWALRQAPQNILDHPVTWVSWLDIAA